MKRTRETKRPPFSIRSTFSPFERGQSMFQFLSAGILFLLLVTGCTQAEVMGEGTNEEQVPTDGGEVEAIFHLEVAPSKKPLTRSITFTAEGVIESDTLSVGETATPDTLQTRAATDLPQAQENKVAGLWIGQFDSSGNTLLSWQYIESVPVPDADQKVKVTAKLAAAANCKVWLVANAGDLGTVSSETALKAKTLTYTPTADGKPKSSLLAMTGTWEGNITGTATPQVLPDIKLTRLAAKITFTYSISGTDFSFTPASVSLKQVPNLSQIGAPDQDNPVRPDNATYTTSYTGTVSTTGATMYWYLPENMAGTAKEADAVSSEKEKTGSGVTNATCIELSGDAVQNGVSYGGVVFRFYPGKDHNAYNIDRNSHYVMNISLKGLDVSDKRITVGMIPPITADSEENLPNTGGSKVVNITSRPGVVWSLPLPLWLSATMDGQTIQGGSTLTNQGAGTITFTAGVNQRGEVQTQEYTIPLDKVKSETFTIAQNASSLTIGAGINLTEPTAGATGSSSFMATRDLPWKGELGEWLAWTPDNPSSGTTTDSPQTLNVKSTSTNPSAQPRTTSLVVKAGASVNDANYTGLKKEINVTQPGSVLTINGETSISVGPEANNNLSTKFTATSGLSWRASTHAGWLSFAGPSGGTTPVIPVTVPYRVAVNPTRSERGGSITLRAGDPSTGPSGTVNVTQAGSVLSITSGTSVSIGAEARDLPLTFTATPGLPWTASVNGSWISLTGATSGNTAPGSVSVPYRVTVNPNAGQRSGSITVRAGDAFDGPNGTVSVMQAGSAFSVSKPAAPMLSSGGSVTGTVTATSGLQWRITPATDNGITVSPTSGDRTTTLTFTSSANSGGSRKGTFNVSVVEDPSRTFQVQATQLGVNTLVIDQALAEEYKVAVQQENPSDPLSANLRRYPPFNFDDYNSENYLGTDYKGISSTATISTAYYIEVRMEQESGRFKYHENGHISQAIFSCPNGWRIPTNIELFAMGKNKDMLNRIPHFYYLAGTYWSSSVFNGVESYRGTRNFNNNTFGYKATAGTLNVRCTREVTY